jgi:transposase
MSRRKRRIFTPEFKAETVRLVRESGRSIGLIAKELDLTENCLRKWVQQDRLGASRPGPETLATAERQELETLRRENKRLRMERDILKKATAFFAKESE